MRFLLSILFFFCLLQHSVSQNRYKDFKEGFEDNTKGWELEEKTKIKKGYLRIKQSSMGPFQKINVNPNYNYTIEAVLTQKTGEKKKRYGIVWGYTDKKNHHVFEINSSGSANIYSKVEGKRIKVVSKSFHSINGKKKENLLKIAQTDKNIDFYINDKLLYTSENICKVVGKVGFKTHKKIRLYVDELKVRYYDEPIDINLVENPINGYTLEKLGDNINTSYSDIAPVISANGSTLYFCRKRYPENIHIQEDNIADDIWFSEFNHKNNRWEKAKNIGPPLNNESHNYLISISPSNNSAILMHTYNADGSPGYEKGVSVSYKRDGKWSIPENQIISDFNNIGKHNEFCLSPSGKQLIMTINDGESHGGRDVYVSFKTQEGIWEKPLNLGEVVNSPKNEISPFLAPDNKTLYFASRGHVGYGGTDIFMAKRLDDSWTNWSEPKNLGPEINGDDFDAYFTLSALGDYAYMVQKSDIYRIKLAESIKPEPTISVQGLVINTKTNQTIDALVKHKSISKDEIIALSNATTNPYKFILPLGSKCKLEVNIDGFFLTSKSMDLSKLAAFNDTTINFYVTSIEDSLSNIYFDSGIYRLRKKEKENLTKIVELLQNYKDLHFRIEGYTDNKPFPLTNQYLSEKRAETVYNFLISKGMTASNLSYKGFGEEKPVESNTTPSGRQMNRRVEFYFNKKE